MLEVEHPEICEADKNEAEFVKRCKQESLLELVKEHPKSTQELPRAQPCQSFMATHRLEFDPRTRTYNPVPVVQQYERGDTP